MSETKSETQHEFKAEVRKLLDILVHSLYSHREIFLRELVSNAADALERLRYEQRRGTAVADDELPLEIRLRCDADQKVLVIEDTGVGLSRTELVENLGTIARSGSERFLQEAKTEGEPLERLIGRFGVGFYSVFMVATQVVVVSRSWRAEEEPVEWRSDGQGSYTLLEPVGPVARGTRIEVHLKDDAAEYATADRVRAVLRQHSNFVGFPILVDDEQSNTVPALWREPKFQVEDTRYAEFYRFLTHDDADPLDRLHLTVDGSTQYTALLFVPPTGDPLMELRRNPVGLQLYSQRVLIQASNTDLLPEYLGFVRGVVDCDDLPLNISRETLQENRLLANISSGLTGKLLARLQELASDEPETYRKLWTAHGSVFKLGYMDYRNREAYAKLLRFDSSACAEGDDPVSLDEYAARMLPGQDQIYYAFGGSRESLAASPHLELLRGRGVEVLYLYEPVDEFALGALHRHGEHELQSAEHADVARIKRIEAGDGGGDEEPDASTAATDELPEAAFAALLERVGAILGERVTAVRASERLQDSPCCLVNADGSLTSSMQKVLQIVRKDSSVPTKVLELNQAHGLVRSLATIHAAQTDDPVLSLLVEQLYESALLLDGYLQDPHALVARTHELLDRSAGWYVKLGASPQGAAAVDEGDAVDAAGEDTDGGEPEVAGPGEG